MTISVDDVRRLDLRVGTVAVAERMAGSDRLLRLVVDVGTEQRVLVARVGRAYAPDELPGRQVVVVMNLKPAVIRGVASEGMLLGVGCDDPVGVALLTVSHEVANGSRVE